MEAPNLVTLAGLDRLTQAIGDPDFGGQLIATIRSVSEADHVMAFAFLPNQPPRVVVSAGMFDEAAAARAAATYAGSLYLLDPNYGAIRRSRQGSAWFEAMAADGGEHFQEAFFGACGVSDAIAFANCQKDIVFYVIIMRGGGQKFAKGQTWLLMQLGEVIVANIHKHFSYMHALNGKNQFVIDRVLAEAPAFAMLTPRERRVCLGILTGYTSESIGFNLEISINSVLTYRKRLYDKLDISSQNELFMKVIAAMMDLSYDDRGQSASHAVRPRPLDMPSSRRGEAFNEYYMAEAFILGDME